MSAGVEITRDQRTWAKVAGIMFLSNYVFQALADVPTIITRRGTAFADNARWAADSQRLYGVWMLELALSWIAIGVLAFALYVALEPVNKRLAQLALFLRLGASFVGASAVMLRTMEARFYKYWQTDGLFSDDQIRALVMTSRRSAGVGIEAAWMFQGLGSVLFFLLFWRSRYLPRWLAAVGMVGSGLVVAMAATMYVFPERINELKLFGLPGFFAEVVVAFWLLIKGLPRSLAATANIHPIQPVNS